jgi:hypothetical protein
MKRYQDLTDPYNVIYPTPSLSDRSVIHAVTEEANPNRKKTLQLASVITNSLT